MRLLPDFVQRLIFGAPGAVRFTQDSPIMPDVWLSYAHGPAEPLDLLITPHIEAAVGEVGKELRERVTADRVEVDERTPGRPPARVAYNQFHIVARLYFDEMIRLVMPMTAWWQRYVSERRTAWIDQLSNDSKRRAFAEHVDAYLKGAEVEGAVAPDLLWMITVVGSIGWTRRHADDFSKTSAATKDVEYGEPITALDMIEVMVKLLRDGAPVTTEALQGSVWSVNRNRAAEPAIARSVATVKADAARQLFDIRCRDLRWAVLDTGIDARHPAFRDEVAWHEADDADRHKWWRFTRVERTYDFTRIRELLDPQVWDDPANRLPDSLKPTFARFETLFTEDLEDLRRHLQKGRQVNWGLLEPFLRVPHEPQTTVDGEVHDYQPPTKSHGTHVAGILGGSVSRPEYDREHNAGDAHDQADAALSSDRVDGLCPDIKLYDMRVLGNGGDEFSVISALQFISWLNGHRDYLVVHGANLSLSILHDVQSYACGATPVCEEADRLVSTGVVVVAAAGNQGYQTFVTDRGRRAGYLAASITDPGNAARAITVGATHRFSPHTYGVSYFSSRGPTGDGRVKPDLLAPGEKVKGPLPDGLWGRKDGTSMAAPHVSGAAALLMARHTELMGKADRVKEILCSTATDLGRERSFQGCGMVDVLRALQQV